MTRRLGSALRVAFDARLPLANFGASPKVTEPLYPMNPVAMARLILPRAAVQATKSDRHTELEVGSIA